MDVLIFRWLNSWVGISPFSDWLIVFQATYLWYVIMASVALFLAVTVFPHFREHRRLRLELFVFVFVSAFAARFVLTEIIRFIYHRPRPYLSLEGVHVLKHQFLGNMTTSGSFPSGHSALAFAVATAVSFYYPKTGILFFLAALLIGLGRVAAGVHWPSDILGGAAVGVGVALALRWVWGRFEQK